jgi:thiamine phosphate synthase YjbQ (UPF0047 family)
MQAAAAAGMKSYRKELWFETKNRMEFVNITKSVQTQQPLR